MRLFIAINFEDAFVDALVSLQDSLQSAGAVGNFTKRENLHMTLAFIGDYGNPEDVIESMVDARFRPLDIRLEGVQQFREMYFARIAENQVAYQPCNPENLFYTLWSSQTRISYQGFIFPFLFYKHNTVLYLKHDVKFVAFGFRCFGQIIHF